MLDGVTDALKMGTKITKILEKLAYDAGVKEQIATQGYTDGVFTLANYRFSFRLEDIEKRTIQAHAEVVEEVQNDAAKE